MKVTPNNERTVNGEKLTVLDPFAKREIKQGEAVDLSKLANQHKLALMRLVKTGDLVKSINKRKGANKEA